MKRLLPSSLFGQTLLLLLAGLVVSHALGAWIYALDRARAVRAVGGLAAAERIATLTQLIDEAPAEWRARLVTAVSGPGLRVSLAPARPDLAAGDDPGTVAAAIRSHLAAALGAGRQMLVHAVDVAGPPFGPGHGPGQGHGMGLGLGLGQRAMMGGARATAVQVAVALAGGDWLVFATALPEADDRLSRQFLVSLLVMAALAAAVAVWAVGRLPAPLGALASAAERFGRDVGAAPLPEAGSREVALATRAFNDMQARLRELVDNRTRLLAALSHDLRTPLTLLRLRTEEVADAGERDRMLATIAEMDEMIGQTLAFAREEVAAGPRRATDLAALIASLVDDRADLGRPVAFAPADPVVVACQPTALKRALGNLIDNAVTHGGGARVALTATPARATVAVDDDGPGIPPAELARVLEPFYRLEASRSRDTGGVGLGLAIAQAAVVAHGGTLTLENRVPHGLRATVTLPR